MIKYIADYLLNNYSAATYPKLPTLAQTVYNTGNAAFIALMIAGIFILAIASAYQHEPISVGY